MTKFGRVATERSSRIVGFVRPMAVALLVALACAESQAQIRITEYMYDGSNGEFVELTNVGGAAVDMTGWSYDDSSRVPGSFSLSGFGSVAPGESVIVTDATAAAFRTAWGLGAGVKIIGGSTQGLGRADEINIYDSSNALVDRLTYDDQTIAGSIRTQNKSGWVCAEGIGANNVLKYFLSAVGDQQNSFTSTGGQIGSPGSFISVACPSAPVILTPVPARKSAVATLPSVSVTFSTNVTGVVAANLTVNGSPATSVTGSGAGPYAFSGFAAPSAGSATITLAAGAIVSQVGSVPFAGDSWTASVGIVVVINEINYHPNDAIYLEQETEFIELYNAGAASVNMSGWQFNQGITYTIPNGTNLAAGAYLVLATNSAALQSATGYAGALQWTTGGSGGLSNSGERLTMVDTSLNVIDTVEYGDSGAWAEAADGDGPSLELRNPNYPNEYGAAWGASIPNNGTPGAQNSVYQASLGPIIVGTAHTPIIPAANQPVSVTATVVDDSPNPTVTLYYRQDQDPTIAYSSTQMFDDGAHGDGQAGDKLYGATMPGLSEGSRMDFTIRADDGSNVSAAPAGNNTLAAGQYPTQTYLCKYSSVALPTDFPSYHLITTQRIRNLQENHIEDEFDATFVRCDVFGNCKNWYNAGEHYRGASSLNQHPHSFRIDLPNSPSFDSEMGFQTTKINVLSQSMFKQYLGMQFFREAFGGLIPTPRSQFVRFLTNPISHGGASNLVYHNIEVLDGNFVESQNGDISPRRWPDRCSTSLAACSTPTDCTGVQTCVPTDDGNLYRGRHDGSRLYYEGTDPNQYRTDASGQNGYQKYTNESEDDWTDLMAVTFALDPSTTPDASYENAVNAVIDEDEWAKWFAIHMLLVNQEGGIYRDTGDDYFMYMQRSTSPGGYNCKMLPWDMDSTFGGSDDTYNIESIWRTTVQNPQRFIRSNVYAGRFVKAICDMLGNEFLQTTMDAKIDALPSAVANATRKSQLKSWVAARRSAAQAEIKTQLTIANLPASPYTNANPVIALNGQLNQCGTRYVKVNGQDADGYSVYLASWNKSITLVPGLNHITVQNLDYTNTEISRIDTTILYDPPQTTPGIRLTVPQRMVNTKTLTLKAELIDATGNIDWRVWNALGTVSATRVSNGQAVPLTVTVFERHTAGAGAGGPPTTSSIRFYNGVGSVSLTLNNGATVPAGDIVITVNANSMTATKLVTVVDAAAPGTFQDLSGTLSGGNLVWEPADGVIHLTGHVNVPIAQTLTIMPGTLIMVDAGPDGDGNRIDSSGGRINALGTRTNPIYFFPTNGAPAMVLPQTGSEGSGNGHNNPACWGGFDLTGDGSMTWSYVFMTGTGNGVVSGHPRPTVIRLANNFAFTATDSMFADSPGKIIYGNGNGVYTFQRCLFARCGIGGEWIGSGYTLTVEDTWMTRIGRAPINSGNRLDGDILHIDQPSNSVVRRCILTDGGDDIIDHSSAATPVVENSILYDANDKTVSIGGGGTITMTNCLVFEVPGGVRCAGVPAYLTHVTFGPNTNVNGQDPANSVIQQSIFWPLGAPTCSSGDMDYCDVANSAVNLGCGTGNISADPKYVDSTFAPPGDVFVNFGLQAGSPALTAGPSGNQIGWLGFPYPAGCVNNGDCNDSNPCTTDTCSNGLCTNAPIANCCQSAGDCNDNDPCTVDGCTNNVCTHTPANCSDGDACTTDSCTSGVGCQHAPVNCDDNNACTIDSCDSVNGCQHTPVGCPPGQSCNPANGQCQTGPVTVTFQNGFSSYTGTVDTYIDSALGSQATATPIVVDSSPEEQVLLRFDNIFGSGPGQIPSGSTISSATLTLWTGTGANDQSANAVNLHRLLHTWSDTGVWANYGVAPWNGTGGIQNDGVDAVAALAGTTTITSAATSANIDVTTSLQAWVTSPATNFGWAILPTGTDGLRLESAESTTSSNSRRPKLSVTYIPPTSNCQNNGDCNDNDACTTDVCDNGSCTHAPITCNDNNACTTDSCNAASGCVYTPVSNGTACSDGDACNGAESCQGGNCTPGTPLNCDDGLACTTDSCNSGTGCVHTDNCPPGSLCNHTTGNCDSPPALPIANGATWKYFKGTAEPAPGDLTSWTHVGYDDSSWSSGASGFGYGDNDDATVLSDMLNAYASVYVRKTFTVANPAAVTQLTLTVDYDDSYIAYINGVEVARSASMGGTAGTPTAFNALATGTHEASAGDSSPQPPEVTHPSPSLLVAGVNVIAIHGHNQTLASTDFSLIPSLTATVSGCSGPAECDDSNPCTIDSCNSGACVHTPVSCPPGQSCNQTNGQCEAGPQTVVFQDGLNGYVGTADTFIQFNTPNAINGALETLRWDTEETGGSATPIYTLIRFDNLFGNGVGQIPAGSTIQSATLAYVVGGDANANGDPGSLRESLVVWDESTATYSNFGGSAGVQSNEYGASVVGTMTANPAGAYTVNVLSSLQSWSANPALNLGWIVIPTAADGVQVRSSDFVATPADRPKLTVTYVVANGCQNNGQCDDGNACTTDVCNAGTCEHTSITCNDNNACTTDTCNPASGCVFTPVSNGTSCTDGDACNGAETCQAGNCTPGTPPNCDDGDPCTTDSCDAQNGCQHAPISGCCHNAGECNDNSACTTDSCVNNVCQHDPVSCDDGVACTTDSCDSVNGCQHANNCSPTVVAAGARYLAITPPPGLASVALRVESTSVPCMPKYVSATGHLSPTPEFQSSAAWGTVYVGDRQITPATAYDVRADVRGPSDPVNLSPPASATTWLWGDANNVGGVDVFDIVCVLDGFQSVFGACSMHGDDLRGDVPDRGVDVFDIVAVLDAYQGTPYPDPAPCASGLMAPPSGGSQAAVSLVPRVRSAAPGGVVRVDVFVSGVPTLRAYQLASDIRGTAGGMSVESVTFDSSRPDYAFASGESRNAVDLTNGRAANALLQGWSDCSSQRYLCTLTLRASGDASGTFTIGLKAGGASVLVGADRAPAAFSATSTKVSIIRTGSIGGSMAQPG